LRIITVSWGLLSLLFFSGCTTVYPLDIPEISNLEAERVGFAAGESVASFALTKVVQDIDRGKKVMAFPNYGSYEGKSAYCNHRGASDLTYVGGRKMLGNWSTEIGADFYDVFSSYGYSVAGDPSDMFNQQYAVNSSEYLVGGRLVDLRGNYCHKHHWWDGRPLNKYAGETYLKIEWSVLNTLTKDVVLTEVTEGYGVQYDPIVDGVYASYSVAFIDAVERFSQSLPLKRLALGKRLNTDEADPDNVEITKIENGIRLKKFNVDTIRPYVITIRVGRGHGSGVIVGKSGYVITNAHVVGDAKNVQVITSMGLEIEGSVIHVDKGRDVALISTPLKIRKSIHLQKNMPSVSSSIFAVGSPLKEELAMTVTKGIVSAIRTDSASGNVFIQGDAAISPGNSGGPVFNSEGSVVAISVAKYSGHSASGLNLFIPIADVVEFLSLEVSD